jgi:hypothetical protein
MVGLSKDYDLLPLRSFDDVHHTPEGVDVGAMTKHGGIGAWHDGEMSMSIRSGFGGGGGCGSGGGIRSSSWVVEDTSISIQDESVNVPQTSVEQRSVRQTAAPQLSGRGGVPLKLDMLPQLSDDDDSLDSVGILGKDGLIGGEDPHRVQVKVSIHDIFTTCDSDWDGLLSTPQELSEALSYLGVYPSKEELLRVRQFGRNPRPSPRRLSKPLSLVFVVSRFVKMKFVFEPIRCLWYLSCLDSSK